MIDLQKQEIKELGEFLSLSRKYKGIKIDDILTVYKQKQEVSLKEYSLKMQYKKDLIHKELKNLFDQGYYKGSIITKSCMTFDDKLTTGFYRLVLTGKIIMLDYRPLLCFYREEDINKKEDVISLDLGPVVKIEIFAPPIKTFDQIVETSTLSTYILE